MCQPPMPQRLNRSLPPSSPDQGFALPLALGIGLIMLLMGITMIARSQTDQVTAVAQKQSAQGLAIAEAGIARTLSELQKQHNAGLLTRTQDPVQGEQADGQENLDPPSLQPCPLDPDLAYTGEIGEAEARGSGTYRVQSYRYDPGPDQQPMTEDDRGILLVEGESQSARSWVEVTVPITSQQVFPGLYASQGINLGNNDVLRVLGETGSGANIICRDCARAAGFCGADAPLPVRRAAIGAGPQAQVDGKILLLQPQLPPVPSFPAGAASAHSLPENLLNSGVQEPTVLLPRATDLVGHTPGTPFHYRIENLNFGNRPLVINSGFGPVYLYVSGNITFSGGLGWLVHIQNPELTELEAKADLRGLAQQLAGRPENFRIYGNPADPEDQVTDQVFTLNGGAIATNVFVYAPDAQVGVNGGSNDPDFQGALWVKTWDGSSSNQVEIRVPDGLPAALGGDFATAGRWVNGTGSILSWERRSVAE
jgi:hypothetical protein